LAANFAGKHDCEVRRFECFESPVKGQLRGLT
jgi:hypothetical protein